MVIASLRMLRDSCEIAAPGFAAAVQCALAGSHRGEIVGLKGCELPLAGRAQLAQVAACPVQEFDDAPPGVGPLRRDRVRRKTVHRGKRLLEGRFGCRGLLLPGAGEVVDGPLLLTERAQEEAGEDFLAQSAHGVLPLGDVLELTHQSEVARDDRFRRLADVVELVDGIDAEPDHQRDDDGEAEKNTVGDRDRHVRLQEQGKMTGKGAGGALYREGRGFRRDRPISAAGLA